MTISVPQAIEVMTSGPMIDFVYPDTGVYRSASAIVRYPGVARWSYLGGKRRPGFGSDPRTIFIRSPDLKEVSEVRDEAPRIGLEWFFRRNDEIADGIGGREKVNLLVSNGIPIGSLAVVHRGDAISEIRLVDPAVNPISPFFDVKQAYLSPLDVVWRVDFEVHWTAALDALVRVVNSGRGLVPGSTLAEATDTPVEWANAFFTGGAN